MLKVLHLVGVCAAFRQGGGGKRGKLKKNMGVPGEILRKSLQNCKNLQLKGGGQDPFDPPPPCRCIVYNPHQVDH